MFVVSALTGQERIRLLLIDRETVAWKILSR